MHRETSLRHLAEAERHISGPGAHRKTRSHHRRTEAGWPRHDSGHGVAGDAVGGPKTPPTASPHYTQNTQRAGHVSRLSRRPHSDLSTFGSVGAGADFRPPAPSTH